MKNINIRGINIHVTPALEEAVEKSAATIMKMKDDNTDIVVKLKVDGKKRHKAEITAICKKKTLRVERETDDMYTSIIDAFDVMERKMAKSGDKVVKRKHGTDSIKMAEIDFKEEADDEIEIVVRKTFPAKPMSPEDACAEMEALDHDFYVFVNIDSGAVEVVYKRNDGKYGLIAVEANT